MRAFWYFSALLSLFFCGAVAAKATNIPVSLECGNTGKFTVFRLYVSDPFFQGYNRFPYAFDGSLEVNSDLPITIGFHGKSKTQIVLNIDEDDLDYLLRKYSKVSITYPNSLFETGYERDQLYYSELDLSLMRRQLETCPSLKESIKKYFDERNGSTPKERLKKFFGIN